MEVFGKLTAEEVVRVDVLHWAFLKLLDKYALASNLDVETYLWLGIPQYPDFYFYGLDLKTMAMNIFGLKQDI